MDFCPKCNLVVAPYDKKHVVGVTVFHRPCWDQYSNWTQAQITYAASTKEVIQVSRSRPAAQ